MLVILSWSGLLATILLFRRLKHVARRIPSRALLHQCNIIGSQLPIAALLIASWDRYNRAPEAIGYAVLTPLPGPGLPWPVALSANRLEGPDWDWNYLFRQLESEFLLGAWAIITLVLAIQFSIALIRVRRADHELTTYSRELLSSQSPSKNPMPPEPSPASSV